MPGLVACTLPSNSIAKATGLLFLKAETSLNLLVCTALQHVLTKPLTIAGDFVGIGPSVTKQFEKWPGMMQTYRDSIYRSDLFLLAHDGKQLGGPFHLSEKSDYRPVPISRTILVQSLYDYAISLGIPVLFSKKVATYGESDDGTRAFVVTESNERLEADLVIAADGIGTKATAITNGKEIRAFSSGQSVYRVTYPTELLKQNSFLSNVYTFGPGQPDYCEVYLSLKGTMIILVSPETTTWLFTHVVCLNPQHKLTPRANKL